jgi:hypothetical protein
LVVFVALQFVHSAAAQDAAPKEGAAYHTRGLIDIHVDGLSPLVRSDGCGCGAFLEWNVTRRGLDATSGRIVGHR